jgi:hypothetical protein
MAFSKATLQEHLMAFLTSFGESFGRMYGDEAWKVLSDHEVIKKSYIWRTVNEMYDFGIAGIPVRGLGELSEDGSLDGNHADVELFFRAIDTGPMALYFEEDTFSLPETVSRTVRTAVARHVLDGGDRYTDFGVGEHGFGNGDWGYLTLTEVALLADMDERSVRNAANPKLPHPLKTEAVGKRSLVTREEARRWLSGRKGFVPTRAAGESATPAPRVTEISVSEEAAQILRLRAEQAGLSIAEYIEKQLGA